MDGEEIVVSDTSNATEIDRSKLVGERYHDRGKLPDEFNKIEVGLRIIPSQNDEGGIIFLPQVFESGEHDSYITKRVNTSAGFFLFDKTQDYFPQIDLNKDNIPLGYPSPLCVHLDWIRKGQDKLKKNYRSFIGFPNCTNAFNGKIRWNLEDPRDGIDLYSYKQYVKRVQSESDCNGVFRQALNREGGRCYTYKRLDSICLTVAFKEEPNTQRYYWEYRGGCYGDKGSIAHYVDADINKIYSLSDVTIEVREDTSMAIIVERSLSAIRTTLSSILHFLALVCFYLSIIGILVFIGAIVYY